MYVSVRGWLQADHQQRAAVEPVIAAASDDFCSGGWGFPAKPFNWSLYVFYGGDIREGEVGWLRDQVREIAALPPADDDGDMPAGLVVLDDEHGNLAAWEIHDGQVHDRPAPELGWI